MGGKIVIFFNIQVCLVAIRKSLYIGSKSLLIRKIRISFYKINLSKSIKFNTGKYYSK